MELDKKQIKKFSYSILLEDVQEYINTHSKEYEEFISDINNS